MQERHSLNGRQRIFYSVERGASVIGCSVRHFRRLAEDNDIPPIEIGRTFFWLHKDIEAIKAIKAGPHKHRPKYCGTYQRSDV